jgi:putative Ig domain-containing protein
MKRQLPLTVLTFVLSIVHVDGKAPVDTPQQHVETITSSRHTYRLNMSGTMDGENTRSLLGSSVPWVQSFEPMRFARIENVGEVNVVNPWIQVNGKRNWRNAQDIVEEALRTYGDPATDAEKARAIYEHLRLHRFHATTGDLEVRDPVKLYNIYGYALCGDNAPALMDLWRVAGLKVRRGFLTGHCISEVWYEDDWHVLDADEQVVCLKRDNETLASEEEIVRDDDLMKRTHSGGIGHPDDPMADERAAACYAYEGGRKGEYASHVGHTMNVTLRPGEAREWRWGHVGKHHYSADLDPRIHLTDSIHLRHAWGEKAWARLSNGKWLYRPPLRKPAGRQGLIAKNARWATKPAEVAVSPTKVGELASLVWKVEAPYVIVGGSLSAKVLRGLQDTCTFFVSFDGQNWKHVTPTDGATPSELKANLDEFFPNKGPARYAYFLRIDLFAQVNPNNVGLESLALENDLQMASLSLPSLRLGENNIAYTDQTPGPHPVRVTFDWAERAASGPPAQPAAPEFPADKGEVEGAQFTFKWRGSPEIDGNRIVDYHFQLGNEPTIRWALSPNFEKLISDTAEKGTASYTIPYSGLLNPGQRYYWRVRAQDERGVWGPWSQTWSFTPLGPGVPLNVKLEKDKSDIVRLVWDINPRGRKPVKFVIYASDEKAFRVSDHPYEVDVGNQKYDGLFAGRERAVFPPNMIATTTASRSFVQPRHAFYRVVAVDEKGNKSGSSDYVSVPRPLIYSEPLSQATTGVPYRYEVKVISSIGDLRFRAFGGNPDSYQAAFWEAEQPRFSLVEEIPRCGHVDPTWLKIDPQTGVLSGTPEEKDAGEYQINVKVEIDGRGTYLQSFPLQVKPREAPVLIERKD